MSKRSRSQGESQPEHTCDADNVTCEQTRGVQGHEDSISHLASNCNGSQTDGEHHRNCHRIDRTVTSISWRVSTVQSKTHTSKPGRTRESQELYGRPPSRANDLGPTLARVPTGGWKHNSAWAYQSCLEVVVTPLTEHDTTRIRITTASTFAAGTECVTLRTTAIYG